MNARALAAAIALDATLGDPERMPHPVRFFGWAIVRLEAVVRANARDDARALRTGGFAIAFGLVGATALVTTIALDAARTRYPRAGAVAEVTLAWTTLALRSLLTESTAVRHALEAGDLERARDRVARIVGRDTADLDARQIARATIETLAESFCDGIVAPMIALTIGGAPMGLAFKAASTLDSMIGHRDDRYRDLGYASAKLDDVFCWLPARVAALAIVACARVSAGSGRRAYAVLRADAARHASPNAGRPEAAIAGALGVRLGGTNAYAGVPSHACELGAAFDAPQICDVARAERIVATATVVCAIASVGARALVDRR